MTDDMVSGGATTQRGIGGEPRLVIGDLRGIPNFGDIAHGSDEVTGPYEELFTFGDLDEDNPSKTGKLRTVYTATMETGDIIKPESMDVVSYRINVTYRPRSYGVRCLVDASEDGGKTWNTAQEYWLGVNNPNSAFKGTENIDMDLLPTHAPVVRYRLRFAPDDIYIGASTEKLGDVQQVYVPENLFEINDITISYESGADLG
jgi:hypothetical protein